MKIIRLSNSLILTVIISILLFSGCHNFNFLTEQNWSDAYSDRGVDIYIIGTDINNIRALYWINNKLYQDLEFANSYVSTSNSIFIDGEDIYICGSIQFGAKIQACYWKNRRIVMLDSSSNNSAANNIMVRSGIVYCSGSDNNNAAYWINNKNFNLGFSGFCQGIYVDEYLNFFIAGQDTSAGAGFLYKSTSGTTQRIESGSTIYSLFVKNNVAYLGGKNAGNFPYYWKENKEGIFQGVQVGTVSGALLYVRSILIDDDMIVFGACRDYYSANNTLISMKTNEMCFAATKFNNDIYLAGYYSGSIAPCYWKNFNQLVPLELKSGVTDYNVMSIAAKKK